ncbi:hypothetical protein B0T17DRAFT_357802 [Bombardia bombarda]|uniref:Uncharacterized protein n=1 Tax=Bombardia bombarda TaxID=252184 RepID=A0AA39WI82_9PEZI|nr:hypothetical protein B0T17DRAFT_357802 [Bombardia bombarda]
MTSDLLASLVLGWLTREERGKGYRERTRCQDNHITHCHTKLHHRKQHLKTQRTIQHPHTSQQYHGYDEIGLVIGSEYHLFFCIWYGNGQVIACLPVPVSHSVGCQDIRTWIDTLMTGKWDCVDVCTHAYIP